MPQQARLDASGELFLYLPPLKMGIEGDLPKAALTY